MEYVGCVMRNCPGVIPAYAESVPPAEHGALLQIECIPGYKLEIDIEVDAYCHDGQWIGKLPKCIWDPTQKVEFASDIDIQLQKEEPPPRKKLRKASKEKYDWREVISVMVLSAISRGSKSGHRSTKY